MILPLISDESAEMQYTLWSNGRLLGHTDLGFRGNTDTAKFGWLYPSEIGERAMHVMTDVSRVFLERDDVEAETLSADLCSASSRIEAMSLELRDDHGTVVNTESIGVRDTEIMLAFAKRDDTLDVLRTRSFHEMMEDDDDCDAVDLECVDAVEGDENEDWREPTPLPRYQIVVLLPDTHSSPPAP